MVIGKFCHHLGLSLACIWGCGQSVEFEFCFPVHGGRVGDVEAPSVHREAGGLGR